jgi:uncharacterized protein YgiM (DUF1202 family)
MQGFLHNVEGKFEHKNQASQPSQQQQTNAQQKFSFQDAQNLVQTQFVTIKNKVMMWKQ